MQPTSSPFNLSNRYSPCLIVSSSWDKYPPQDMIISPLQHQRISLHYIKVSFTPPLFSPLLPPPLPTPLIMHFFSHLYYEYYQSITITITYFYNFLHATKYNHCCFKNVWIYWDMPFAFNKKPILKLILKLSYKLLLQFSTVHNHAWKNNIY